MEACSSQQQQQKKKQKKKTKKKGKARCEKFSDFGTPRGAPRSALFAHHRFWHLCHLDTLCTYAAPTFYPGVGMTHGATHGPELA
jgi:hypothetical protein